MTSNIFLIWYITKRMKYSGSPISIGNSNISVTVTVFTIIRLQLTMLFTIQITIRNHLFYNMNLVHVALSMRGVIGNGLNMSHRGQRCGHIHIEI